MNKPHALDSINKLKPIIVALLIATAFIGITVVAGSAENKNTVLINLQVDAENTGEYLLKVLGELEERGYTTTVYVTGSFAENNGHIIQEIQEHGHDIAFHGWATGENLTTMNYSMQQEILIKAKNSVENYSEQVDGFRPQYYSQNEDTYSILDSLNISYDSGFISGLKYIPGYENYSIPYKVPNHSFYAVPVSSYRTPDKIVYLCDLSASNKFKLNATEWSSILNNEFDENKKNNEPMVVVIHPWITGNETTGYWQAFIQFLDRIENKNIDIVKTSELLEFYVLDDEEPENYLGNEDPAIFGMPEFDVNKTYTYNTTFDFFVEGRNGKDAVLYWGEKTEIDGNSYYIFNLTKVGGGETQFIGVDTVNKNVLMKGVKDYTTTVTFMDLLFNPATLVIDYPLWVGKTWERVPSDFSGTVWMERPVFINGKTWGDAKVIEEEMISVPAGIASTIVIETFMNSSMNQSGREIWMNTSQKLWVMENGFFAKRQLYHDGRFEEELELKDPIIADLDIEKEHLKNKNIESFEVSIKLPEKYDLSEVDMGSIKCNGVPASKVKIEDGDIKVRIKLADFANPVEGSLLLTMTGEFNDGTLFEGFEKVKLEPGKHLDI